jgi:hypothetical protein
VAARQSQFVPTCGRRLVDISVIVLIVLVEVRNRRRLVKAGWVPASRPDRPRTSASSPNSGPSTATSDVPNEPPKLGSADSLRGLKVLL